MGAASSIYIALHVHDRTLAPSANTYPSWALLASPAHQQKWESKSATGTLYHASNGSLQAVRMSPSTAEPYILLRVLIAKDAKEGNVKAILDGVPTKGAAGDGGKTWVKDALRALDAKGCLGSKGKVVMWPNVEGECLRYLERKRKARRWEHVAEAGGDVWEDSGEGGWKKSWTPCWDAVGGVEMVN